MSICAETQTASPQSAQVVEEVFTEQHPSLQDIVLGDMQHALRHQRPDLAYEAAGVAVPLQDFEIDELPEGVLYDENSYAVPDFAAEGLSAAEQARRIFDRVGSICFGAPGEVQIYAPDGRHTFTGDLPKLVNFLGEKGYRQAEVVAPQGTLIQPKPPRVDTKMLPIGAPETEFDSAALIGSATKLDVIREMAQAARENVYTVKTQKVEQSPVAGKESIFSAAEQLLAVSRILLDKTFIRHEDGLLEEHSLRNTLLSKYNLTEHELDAAFKQILDPERRLQLFAELQQDTETLAIKSFQPTSNYGFDTNTSKIVNAALREFIAARPSDLDKAVVGVSPALLMAYLEARTSAPVRKTDVELAKLLIGNEKEAGELTLCTTDELAPLRDTPLEAVPVHRGREAKTTTHAFTSTVDRDGVYGMTTLVKNEPCGMATPVKYEPTVEIPLPVIEVAEPTVVVPAPQQELPSKAAILASSVKASFRKFGRRVSTLARSITRQYV